MRKAASLAAKEAIESLLRTEIWTATLGYGKYDPSGKNSGDSRNGTYERTVRTSLGPITVEVPRDRNGEYKPIAIPRYRRRTDLITSTVLKPCSSGMTDDEMRLAISSIYEANCSKSTLSAITDAVIEDVRDFSKRGLEEIEVAVTDGLSGIDEAVAESYPFTRRQRRFVHLLKNVCSKVRVTDRQEAADTFMGIAKQEGAESGKKALGDFVAKWKSKYPKLEIWSEKAEHMSASYEFLRELRGLVCTSNRIESFNKQIKRIIKKQLQSAAELALKKRIVSMVLHYDEDVGRRKANAGGRSSDITSRNRQNSDHLTGTVYTYSPHFHLVVPQKKKPFLAERLMDEGLEVFTELPCAFCRRQSQGLRQPPRPLGQRQERTWFRRPRQGH